MSDAMDCSWLSLFYGQSPSLTTEPRRFRLLLRHGDELLYLPENRQLALCGLQLYQPQSVKARWAMWAYQLWTALNLPSLSCEVTVSIDPAAPLARFFQSLAGGRRLPDFAVLPGNPHTKSRRFVFLLFDPENKKRCVVKAGFEATSRALIKQEASFLRKHGSTVRHMPSVLDDLTAGSVAAVAFPFFPGRSPAPDDMATVGIILDSWLQRSELLPLMGFAAYRRFVEVGGTYPPRLQQRLQDIRLRPALYHGDFAPWNIRETSDYNTTVLDWERGEAAGIPGWDWFHYLVQTSILVRKEKPHVIYQRALQLFASPRFCSYARAAGFSGQELALLATYLGYAEQIGQTEELATLTQLKQDIYSMF
jgi:hypothetical protein